MNKRFTFSVSKIESASRLGDGHRVYSKYSARLEPMIDESSDNHLVITGTSFEFDGCGMPPVLGSKVTVVIEEPELDTNRNDTK